MPSGQFLQNLLKPLKSAFPSQILKSFVLILAKNKFVFTKIPLIIAFICLHLVVINDAQVNKTIITITM